MYHYTEKQIVQLFVAIETEGKDGHFHILLKLPDRSLLKSKDY